MYVSVCKYWNNRVTPTIQDSDCKRVTLFTIKWVTGGDTTKAAQIALQRVVHEDMQKSVMVKSYFKDMGQKLRMKSNMKTGKTWKHENKTPPKKQDYAWKKMDWICLELNILQKG